MGIALQMVRTLPETVRILVVDVAMKVDNDRTWAFWSDGQLPLGLDTVISHRWESLRFSSPNVDVTQAIAPFQYQYIRSLDYYKWMQSELAHHPQVTWLYGRVDTVEQMGDVVHCTVDGQYYTADRLFDSRPQLPKLHALPDGIYFLWQHFKGWVIETDTSVFDVDTATLMDFTVDQSAGTSFCYVLPFAANRALVEYTVFSKAILPDEDYAHQLAHYCRETLGLKDYRIVERESGRIPMTNSRLYTPTGDRIHPIGTAANAVKSTTGYAFLNIHAYNEQIVAALARGEAPPTPSVDEGRFAWYDSLLLHLLERHPEKGVRIFSALFRSVSMVTILRFLEERTTVWQESWLFSRLPIGLFIRALLAHHGWWKSKPFLQGGVSPRMVSPAKTSRA